MISSLGRYVRRAGALSLILVAGPAFGQTVARSDTTASAARQPVRALSRWENVGALASGARLRVQLVDGTRMSGTLVSVSSDQLAIQPDGGGASVAWRRIQVTRVEQRRGPRVRSGAGWGALVGGLVGAIALGLIKPADAVTAGVGFYHEIPVLATTTGIGVGTGSVVNALRRRWVVVYVGGSNADYS